MGLNGIDKGSLHAVEHRKDLFSLKKSVYMIQYLYIQHMYVQLYLQKGGYVITKFLKCSMLTLLSVRPCSSTS
jgi:hypothetical protein